MRIKSLLGSEAPVLRAIGGTESRAGGAGRWAWSYLAGWGWQEVGLRWGQGWSWEGSGDLCLVAATHADFLVGFGIQP